MLIQDYLSTFYPEYEIDKEWVKQYEVETIGGYAPIDELPEGAKEGHSGYAQRYDRQNIPAEPSLKILKWQRYKYNLVLYTNSYANKLDQVTKLASDPLLPNDLRNKIIGFIGSLEDNIGQIRDVLTTLSQDLPQDISELELRENIKIGWAWNKYRDDWKELYFESKDINLWVNNYLQVNVLNTL